jgi:histidine ammonia-lyase
MTSLPVPLSPSISTGISTPATKAAYDVIRSYVKKLDEDRPLFDDINRLANAAKHGTILQAVKQVADLH